MNTQSRAPKSRTIVSGVCRPSWSREAKQNVLLLRDASGSMSGQKAKDASAAGLDLVAELAQPANKDGFIITVINFSDDSRVIHRREKATELHGKMQPLDADGLGGSTNITAGLVDAFSILAESPDQQGTTYLRPVVICFTDGRHNSGPDPHDEARRLKEIADIVTVAFGSDADETLMRTLASTPQHFYRCSDGRALRDFLAKVGATMTATMAARSNATQALTQIQR